MTTTLRLLVADDHPFFLEGLRTVLRKLPAYELAATASNGWEVLEKLDQYAVDVLLLDLQMPEMDGLEAAATVRARHPKVAILVLSMHNEQAFIRKMHQVGVSGYILKNNAQEELYHALEAVRRGRTYFSSEVTETLLKQNKPSWPGVQLSRREREVLEAIAQSKRNTEIAEVLHISPLTVKTHRRNLLRKFEVSNTAGLIKRAMELGYL